MGGCVRGKDMDALREARAKLTLFYGIGSPTDRQAAMFAIYGESAPFLQERTQTAQQIGGSHMNTERKNIESILTELRGTKQLLTLLCNSVTRIDADIAGNPQEALFAIERLLEKNISDIETAVYRK